MFPQNGTGWHPLKSSITLSSYSASYQSDWIFNRNTIIVNNSPQATNPTLEMTTNPPSQTQKSDTQEINEDIRQTHKIYHFENCGTVYLDSLNTRGVRIENCGNNVPQVICSLSFSPHCCSLLTWLYHIIQITVPRLLAMRRVYTHNLM